MKFSAKTHTVRFLKASFLSRHQLGPLSKTGGMQCNLDLITNKDCYKGFRTREQAQTDSK